MNNKKINNFSASRAILASLWKLKESSREHLLSYKYIKLLCPAKHRTTYRTCIFRLCRSGFVKKDYNNILVLAKKGEEESLFSFIEAELSLFKQENQKWDGGWRIILFDIPENKRKYRDYLRKVIKNVGFYKLQKSIWVYPYPVPGFLKELIFQDNIKPHIRFITTNLVDDDGDLKKIFGLLSGGRSS